jgi:hypothetical protein
MFIPMQNLLLLTFLTNASGALVARPLNHLHIYIYIYIFVNFYYQIITPVSINEN